MKPMGMMEQRPWVPRPERNKRFAHGDDYAGDAWHNIYTGETRWCAVGINMNTGKPCATS